MPDINLLPSSIQNLAASMPSRCEPGDHWSSVLQVFLGATGTQAGALLLATKVGSRWQQTVLISSLEPVKDVVDEPLMAPRSPRALAPSRCLDLGLVIYLRAPLTWDFSVRPGQEEYTDAIAIPILRGKQVIGLVYAERSQDAMSTLPDFTHINENDLLVLGQALGDLLPLRNQGTPGSSDS